MIAKVTLRGGIRMVARPKRKPTKKSRTKKPQLFLSRPRDRSLEAYKEWINGMVKALADKANDDMSEKEWARDWKAFWKGATEQYRRHCAVKAIGGRAAMRYARPLCFLRDSPYNGIVRFGLARLSWSRVFV